MCVWKILLGLESVWNINWIVTPRKGNARSEYSQQFTPTYFPGLLEWRAWGVIAVLVESNHRFCPFIRTMTTDLVYLLARSVVGQIKFNIPICSRFSGGGYAKFLRRKAWIQKHFFQFALTFAIGSKNWFLFKFNRFFLRKICLFFMNINGLLQRIS